jgi:hypothetical protein
MPPERGLLDGSPVHRRALPLSPVCARRGRERAASTRKRWERGDETARAASSGVAITRE